MDKRTVILAALAVVIVTGLLYIVGITPSGEVPIEPPAVVTVKTDAAVKDVKAEPFPLTFVQEIKGPVEYRNDYLCLSIVSRSTQDGGWTIPYPNHLVVKEGAAVVLDCGFFDKHRDGWRVAYCKEGATRKPRRLYFLKQGEELSVQVDEQTRDRTMRIYTNLKEGKCAGE